MALKQYAVPKGLTSAAYIGGGLLYITALLYSAGQPHKGVRETCILTAEDVEGVGFSLGRGRIIFLWELNVLCANSYYE